MKRIIAVFLVAAFSTAALAQGAFSDGDPYRTQAGSSESDNVVQSTGG